MFGHSSFLPAATGSVIPDFEFETVIWTGDNATSRGITGVGFTPDLTFIKSRSLAASWGWYDSVRGAGYWLRSDGNSSQIYQRQNGYLSSFDTNGFTLQKGASTDPTYTGWYETNQSGQTYVAYNFKAGGAASLNENGSIDSQVSASNGFSVVSWTGDGNDATVGHGLSQAPEMIITKGTTNLATYNQWSTYHEDLSTNYLIYLNLTDAQGNGGGGYFRDSALSSTVFGLGNDIYGPNVNGTTMIAYCFHSIAGVSKVGSYVGGSTGSGNEITTGFKPQMVILKTYTAGGEDWHCFDNVRGGSDSFVNDLRPNTNEVESTYAPRQINFTSTGFYWTGSDAGVNGSGKSYIYIAFA